MSRFLSIILLLMLSLPAFSREKKEWPPYDLKRHEFALSGAVYPGRYAFGYDFDFIVRKYDSYPYYIDSDGKTISSLYVQEEGALSLDGMQIYRNAIKFSGSIYMIQVAVRQDNQIGSF